MARPYPKPQLFRPKNPHKYIGDVLTRKRNEN